MKLILLAVLKIILDGLRLDEDLELEDLLLDDDQVHLLEKKGRRLENDLDETQDLEDQDLEDQDLELEMM
jgi:hypothetical protein